MNKVNGIILSIKNQTLAARLSAMGIKPGQQIALIRKLGNKGSHLVEIQGKCYAMRPEEFNEIVIL
ncbi:MAG: FeoA family protein [Saprospiraceae bacterium]|jgi:Fe2+ transport system protein FeoA|nr:ferrous iron transport protein A [Saprospiraceae bacterium]MBK7468014.1 ferrous iron transport protein A [Saprospiraceae bacterium]MBK8623801.1 ferrous iron transport protein A [Saprospiraceae bacterium]MBK9994350.1 ferrous iron transport protein A [Saprospiraceae bacterium]